MSQNGDNGIGYDHTHRAFLQALLSRQVVTFAEAKPLLAKIQSAHGPNRRTHPEDITREDFDHYVHTVNDAISPFDLEIRSTHHQRTKQEVFALVNTSSDALTQLATSHTADEIAFIKRVLDAMFETYNTRQAEVMAVTGMQALKLAKPSNGDASRRESGTPGGPPIAAALTASQAEKVLKSMVQEGWFEQSQKGYYTLSPRALMELRGWLVDTYNEERDEDDDDDDDDGDDYEYTRVKTCAACREIVTVGQRCPNRGCLGRLHDHCLNKMFRAQGSREICSECKQPWKHPLPVGEKAARVGQQSQDAGAGNASRSGNAVTRAADESEDDSE